MMKFLLAVLFLSYGIANPLWAETSVNHEAPIVANNALYEQILARQLDIERLKQKNRQKDKKDHFLLKRRLFKLRIRLIEKELTYVRRYLQQDSSQEKSPSAYQEKIAKQFLLSHTQKVDSIHRELSDDVDLPTINMDIAEEMAVYHQIFSFKESSDHVYALYIQSIQLSKTLNMDVSENEKKLRHLLEEVAESNSTILEFNIDNSLNLNKTITALPNDTDLKARLSLTDQRITLLAQSLQASIDLMAKLNMDVSSYQELVIIASGQLTTDIFDKSVITRLVKEWRNKLTLLLIEDSPDILLKILLFIVIILIAIKASRLSKVMMNAAILRSGAHFSQLLRRMLISILSNGILILGGLIALSQIGISLAPLLAGLGVAGFIIGFAMQDTLSNFASGMMILMYRPFDQGDMIEAGGVYGCVDHMNLVSTTILTLDNQTIVVPNNKIWGDVIKNFTHQKTRRVDLLFGIAYGDDLIHAEKVLWEILNKDERILKTPEPLIKIHELGESSVNIAVRPWAKTDDYWDLYWDLTRTVKLRFDEEGISIPFPQQELHLNAQQPIQVSIQK